MLSRAMRHRLGLTVAGASSPSMKAYSPKFHSTVPLFDFTMPSGTGAIRPRLAASKSPCSAKGSLGGHRRIGGPGGGLGVAGDVEMRCRTGTAEAVAISVFPHERDGALCGSASGYAQALLATIRRTVSALPGVEEGTSYGTPASAATKASCWRACTRTASRSC